VTRKTNRTQDCTPSQARTRRRQAELYLDVAESVLANEAGEEATVATGNAVLAGIAAADAICCALSGQRYRGSDHRRAADHLETVTGDRSLARHMRDLIDLKDTGHYGLEDVRSSRATAAVRKATHLVQAARDHVR
jgi:hypothetical protein